MNNKTELYRKINAIRPDIVERLISLWGSKEFGDYVGRLFRIAVETRVPLRADLEAAIAGLVEEHRREFPQFDASTEVNEQTGLEQNPNFQAINGRFPHIARRIRTTWGSRGFGEYLNDLFNDTRSGTRQGFPPDILMALFKIQCDHDQEYPQFASIIRDIWSVGGEHP